MPLKDWEDIVEEGPLRLDKWLHEKLPGHSMNKTRELIASGRVKVGKHRPQKGDRLQTGDIVTVEGLEAAAGPVPEDKEFKVAYEDEDLAVVEKPWGTPTHPLSPEEKGTLTNAAFYKWPEMESVGDNLLEPGLVHRLDNKTGGLVVFAKNNETFDFFKHELRMHRVRKVYRAVVSGDVRRKKGEIDAPLARHPSLPGTMVVADPGVRFRGNSMKALTRYRVLEKSKGYTLLELDLITGVMHQLRVHLAAIGHPIFGDDKYGECPAKDSTAFALQAYRLSFMQPRSRETLDVRCENPLDFDFIDSMRRA